MNFLPLALNLSNELVKDYIIFGVVVLAIAIFFFIKNIIQNKKKPFADEATFEEDTSATPIDETPIVEEIATEPEEEVTVDLADTIPHIPGFVVLDGVSEQDAAVIMAITSHQTGIDLARLDFKSIKRLNQNPVLENIAEQDAAAIMAITADKTGIPLNKLIFNSIKLVED